MTLKDKKSFDSIAASCLENNRQIYNESKGKIVAFTVMSEPGSNRDVLVSTIGNQALQVAELFAAIKALAEENINYDEEQMLVRLSVIITKRISENGG